MSMGDTDAGLPVTEADLLAYADGRLAEARRADIETYLAAHPEDAERVHAWRRQNEALRALFDDLRQRGFALDTLSMGMSADLEAAVAEGATLVRIGTAIFGART